MMAIKVYSFFLCCCCCYYYYWWCWWWMKNQQFRKERIYRKCTFKSSSQSLLFKPVSLSLVFCRSSFLVAQKFRNIAWLSFSLLFLASYSRDVPFFFHFAFLVFNIFFAACEEMKEKILNFSQQKARKKNVTINWSVYMVLLCHSLYIGWRSL